MAALHEVCALLEADPRPLLLTGSGGVFAAGADITQLRQRRRDDALAAINQTVFDRIARLPLPTVAAVDGRSAAKAVLLAGHLLDADAAYRLGLVMEITTPGSYSAGHTVLDRICGQSALALRLTKLVAYSGAPHPLADDLAQAILFETEDKDQRMAEFLNRGKR